MIGPVFSLELLRQRRRPGYRRLRRAYDYWLAFVLFFLCWHYSLVVLLGPSWRYISAANELIEDFTELFVLQQYALLLLVMPAFASGSITDEKTRDTLQGLLLTPLTSGAIILGKLLAHMTLVLELALSGLPLFVFVATLGGWGPELGLAVVVSPVPSLLALASASLLTSVFCRTTSGAVLSCYLLGGLAAIALWQCGGQDYLDPRYVLAPMWDGADWREWARRAWETGRLWIGLALPCLAVAAWRLRPNSVRQPHAATTSAGFLSWRPPVGDDPLCWKDRWIERLTLPGSRVVPRRLWRSAAVLLGVVVLAWIVLASAGAPDVRTMLFLGFAAVPCFGLAVATRAAGSVSGERERQTWDTLFTTPLDAGDIIRGKYRGILATALPYLIVSGALGLVLSALSGASALGWTAYLVFLTWLVMRFLCAHALGCAVQETSPLQGLARSLLLGSWYVLLLTACGCLLGLVIGCLLAVVLLGGAWMFGFDGNHQWQLWLGDFVGLAYFFIGPGFAVPFLFFHAVEGDLYRAEQHVECKERVGTRPTLEAPPPDGG